MKWSGKLSALWSGIVESRPCCFVNAVKELIVFFSEESLWSEAVFSIQTMLPYKVGWMLVKEAALCGRVVPRWSPELAVRAKINMMKEGERGRRKQTSVFWCFHAIKIKVFILIGGFFWNLWFCVVKCVTLCQGTQWGAGWNWYHNINTDIFLINVKLGTSWGQ